MSTRPAYWANEPRAGVESGMLVAVGSLAVAIPTYLFMRLLVQFAPDDPQARRSPEETVALHRRSATHRRSARIVAWFVTSSRRSILYVNVHRSGPRCRFIPSCGEYAVLAVERFGLRRGLRLLGGRLRRCSPDYVGDYLDFPC
ncbi:MAG TPA: membrane protein insertion efficiency factor YidD [Vicinamibacterales bacterium]|jgi:hypothetical protein|nr:membrane protein insertion efficiency factor YidD [Vicinamibacterales bacterium]HEX2462069.1 membrane protein insertion efficiency factor YidD [Vicinamibacterales bacterium]